MLVFVNANAQLLLKLATKNSPSLQVVLPLKFRLRTSSFSLKNYRAEKLIASLYLGHAIMKVFLSKGNQPMHFARCSWRATNSEIYVLRV